MAKIARTELNEAPSSRQIHRATPEQSSTKIEQPRWMTGKRSRRAIGATTGSRDGQRRGAAMGGTRPQGLAVMGGQVPRGQAATSGGGAQQQRCGDGP